MAKVMRIGLAAAFALFMLVPVANAAVEKGQIFVGPSAQVGLPFGDFGDVAGFGFGFGGVGDYMVSDKLAIGGDIIYNFFSSELESDTEGFEVDSPTVLQIGAHAKMFFNPLEDTNPFVFGGLAIYNSDWGGASGSIDIPGVGGFDFDVSTSTTDIGLNGGGGAMFKAGDNMNVAAQGHIHMILSDPSAMYVGGAVTLLFGLGGN